MIFSQYYLDCLSQASYLIADETSGQAVIVDPRRDVDEYLADAQAHGLTVVGVINTHFHADFLAGHLELAARTGAWIGYGRRAETEYPIRELADGERIELGDVTLRIMETPGHTPESISVVVYEQPDDAVPYGVLTGDALFIGDVGRPDLLASVGVTAEELGAMLYDSVHRKLMALPDETLVFPAHGAGSACGKNLSTDRRSTIGRERATNYACAPMDERAFVALVTAGQPSAPGYFGYDADLNRRERDLFDPADVRALTADDFLARHAEGALVVDGRDPAAFAAGHLVGSLNVPADGRFAEQSGTILAPESELLVIAPEGRGAELVTRLARIGFDRATGHLADPEALFVTHPELMRRGARLTVHTLRAELAGRQPPLVVDVRGAAERESGAIPGSLHLPLAELLARHGELPTDRRVVLHCAGGSRSSIAASLLRHQGHQHVYDLIGGYGAWEAAPTV
ncbi:rhodanese-like domain-containing protein [Kitasatospora sp. NPDC051170]|uniref:rhodanese-like domain-containing protein n=1 Tax=Kitasatospora sp. NPDC051170 TaxID=3364056 RepID=UPI0037AF73D3